MRAASFGRQALKTITSLKKTAHITQNIKVITGMHKLIRLLIYKKTSLTMRVRGILTKLYLKSIGAKCGKNLQMGARVTFRHPAHKNITFGNNVLIGDNVTFDIEATAELIIGDSVKITGNCYIAASKKIHIGESTLIAEYVSIRDSNHATNIGTNINAQPLQSENLIIGRDVWIGRGCAIIKGATVKDGSVIAANSVLNKQTYDNSIFAGAPAVHIKNRFQP